MFAFALMLIADAKMDLVPIASNTLQNAVNP